MLSRRAKEYALRLGLNLSARKLRRMDEAFLDQLDRCKDDDSRRILLRHVTGTKPTRTPISEREGMKHTVWAFRRWKRAA